MRLRFVATLAGPAGRAEVPVRAGADYDFEAATYAEAWRRLDLGTLLGSLFGGVEMVGLRLQKAPEGGDEASDA